MVWEEPSFSALGKLSPSSLVSDRWENRFLQIKALAHQAWSLEAIHRAPWLMLLNDIYILHIAFTELFLGRPINPPGFWWLLVRLLPPPSPGLVHFPQWPGTSALLLYSLVLGLAVPARQFSTWIRCYPKQTVVGGLFINLFAAIGNMQSRKALQRQGVTHVEKVDKEELWGSYCVRSSGIPLLLWKSSITYPLGLHDNQKKPPFWLSVVPLRKRNICMER